MSLKHGWSKDAEQSGDFTPYVAIQTEHGRIGLVTCKRCGSAVILDEEKATIAHLRWHLEPEGAAVPAAPPLVREFSPALRRLAERAVKAGHAMLREEAINYIAQDIVAFGTEWDARAAPLAGEAEEPKRCNDLCPPSYQGHWRDWHKGHGCDVEARTLIGKPEPAPEPTLIEHQFIAGVFMSDLCSVSTLGVGMCAKPRSAHRVAQ